jgi:hypothetical protein
MILYDSVVSGSLVVSSSITANAPLTISGSTASSGILFGSSFWQIASAGASLTYNGGTGYIFNAGTSNPYKFNFANNTLMQLTGSTGALMLQSSGSFVDNGYRLQVQTGASGSLWASGSAVFSGSVSVVGNLTSTGTITAQTLVVQTITSSIEYSSGSNIFGQNTGNTHQFTGSVLVSGSQTVNGTLTTTYASLSQAGSATVITQNARFANTTTSTANGSGVGFDFALTDATGAGKQTGQIASIWSDNSANDVADLAFYTRPTGAGISEKLRITGNGNVGIGTTNPTVALEISTGAGSGANRVLLKPTTDFAFYQINNTAGTTYIGTDNSTGAVFGNGAYAMNIYNSYAGNINFYTNSALRMSISSSGNIGIGTSSPSYQLDVNGTGRFSGDTTIGVAAAATNVQIIINGVANKTGRIKFQESGTDSWLIGNGAASENGNFEIYNANGQQALVFTKATSAATFSSSVLANSNINSNSYITSANTGFGNPGGFIVNYGATASSKSWRLANDLVAFGDFAIQQSTTQTGSTYESKMYFGASGNVGIGTTAPSAIGTGYLSLTTNGVNGGGLVMQVNGTPTGYLYTESGALVLNNTSGVMQFYNAGSERMRITSGGFTKASNMGSYLSASGNYHELCNSTGGEWNTIMTNSATNPYGMLISHSTNISNSGNEFLVGYVNNINALRFKFASNGGLYNFQANDSNLSDIRTKKEITSLESYWDKFKALDIVKFKYKDQSHDDFNIGVIAQQVESVAPEFINDEGWGKTPEDGVPLKSIYTADLYHASIKVLQEAMAKIETLEAKVTALENK